MLLEELKYKKYIISIFFTIFFLYGFSDSQTQLTKSEDIQKFKEISDKLICQCGCHLALSKCHHLQCMAWSMRSVIDSYVLQNKSTSSVVHRFANGFHEEFREDSAFNIVKKKYSNYSSSFESGFGDGVIYRKPGTSIILGIVCFIILVIFIFILFLIKTKNRKILTSSLNLSKKEEELLKKMNEST